MADTLGDANCACRRPDRRRIHAHHLRGVRRKRRLRLDGATVTTTVTQTETDTGGSTGDGTAAGAPCDAGTFLSVLKPAMDSTAGDLTIVKVKVTRCRNDYAFVLAIPDNSGCQSGGSCYDSAQVLLSWDGTKWNDPELRHRHRLHVDSAPRPDARRVQGARLPDPHVPGLPDAVQEHRLPAHGRQHRALRHPKRLEAAAGESCAGDWTSAAIAAKGPWKPLCVSDTVYDESAPTLADGSVWEVARLCRRAPPAFSARPCLHPQLLPGRQSWSAS